MVVAAALVKAGSHRVLPLDVEEMRHADGQDEQDGAINAAKRLIPRVRQEHPQLPLIIGGDDLYCHEPFVLELREHRMHDVLVCKPGSHPWGVATFLPLKLVNPLSTGVHFSFLRHPWQEGETHDGKRGRL